MGTAVAQWLRHCATNQKDAGSIPAGVSGIFHWRKNPSDRAIGLGGSTRPLQGAFPGARKADNLTTILCRCHEIWEP